MKTAFIRISAENDTKDNGMVTYTFEDIKQILLNWSQSLAMKYYAIEHNGEEGDENKHYHVVLDFGRNTNRFSTIKNLFPYGNIESARSIRNAVQYLVHLNDLSKKAYSWDEVFTNDLEIGKHQVMSVGTIDMKLKQYIDRIMNGEIREYNFAEEIEPEVFVKRRSQLTNALELYRQKISQDKSRNIKVIVCQGASGTGKTTWAKQYAIDQGKSLCISSANNDPWQDYRGEDVLILDELKSSDMDLSNLLKTLDNHTKSTSKSRYYNKLFLGDTIIITTNEEWQDWYKNDNPMEEIYPLYRRAEFFFKFKRLSNMRYSAGVELYKWDNNKFKYEYQGEELFDFAKYIPNTTNDDAEVFSLFGSFTSGKSPNEEEYDKYVEESKKYQHLRIGAREGNGDFVDEVRIETNPDGSETEFILRTYKEGGLLSLADWLDDGRRMPGRRGVKWYPNHGL